MLETENKLLAKYTNTLSWEAALDTAWCTGLMFKLAKEKLIQLANGSYSSSECICPIAESGTLAIYKAEAARQLRIQEANIWASKPNPYLTK